MKRRIQNSGPALFPKGTAPRKAFTLMELLVSVAIMVMMMVAFGLILTQSQKVVAGSENLMRSNNTAAAIARTIQEDLSQISKDGFLCITRFASLNRPYLLFTTSGIRQSRTGTYRTLDGLSVYGWTIPNHPSGGGFNANLLFYQGWLLWRGVGGNEYDLVATDVLNTDLARIQIKSRTEINTFIDLFAANRLPPDNPNANAIMYPPDTFQQISNSAWQILSPEVNSLSIQWSDGTKDLTTQNLYWYGIEWTGSAYDASGKDSGTGAPNDEWDSKTIADNVPEFDSATGAYRGLWTNHNQNNWPKALRIKFQTYDPTLSTAMQGSDHMWYEVIVPLN